MYSVGVSQRVRVGGLRQASALAGMGDGLSDGLSAQRLVGNLPGEQPFPRSHFPPIGAQQFQQLGGELDVAVLMTFALLDADHHALAVDVGSARKSNQS